MRTNQPLWGMAALASALLATATPAKICVIDDVPAATALVPYIAVRLDDCDLGSPRSDVNIHNFSSSVQRIKVTVWSNLGVPVLDATTFIGGLGSARFGFGDLVCTGELARFGLSLGTGELAHLQAYLTGEPSPQTGDCASVARREGVAEAYITIDQIQQDTELTPADSGYYASDIIGRDNVLAANYRIVDIANNFSEAWPAVALEAVPAGDTTFGNGSVTFYGRYNGQTASDGREPLPTKYAARFDLSDTDPEVFVWREADAQATPVACGTTPSWYPLEHSNRTGQGPGISGLLIVDEDGLSDYIKPVDALPLTTQRVGFDLVNYLPGTPIELPTRKARGWLRLNLQHSDTAYGAGHFGQAWVATTQLSAGRFQTGATAVALDSSCSGSDLAVDTSGRAQ